MTALFQYPKNAAVGRVVPKTKIYEHAPANTALKSLFVRDVDRIVWRFKLSPETTNLSETESVKEIQIVGISLKTGKFDEKVLRGIDKAIPFPLIFELTHGPRRKVAAAFKRPSQADSTKWVTSEYFVTDWIPERAARAPLPVALNLAALYREILTAMMPVQVRCGEDVHAYMARLDAVRFQARELDRIKRRLANERQFNKRIAIYAELRSANLRLERLTTTDACTPMMVG